MQDLFRARLFPIRTGRLHPTAEATFAFAFWLLNAIEIFLKLPLGFRMEVSTDSRYKFVDQSLKLVIRDVGHRNAIYVDLSSLAPSPFPFVILSRR